MNESVPHLAQDLELFYSNWWNRAAFFLPSILNLVFGNSFLILIIQHTRENQYALITDRLDLLWQCSAIFHNFARFIYGMVLFASSKSNTTFCVVLTLIFVLVGVVIGMNVMLSFALRLLYLTRWKNVGTLNDDFCLAFLQTLAIFTTALYGFWYIVFGKYEENVGFMTCCRKSPNEINKSSFDPIIFMITIGFTLVVAHTIIMFKERKKLQNLQRSQDRNGLPRVGDTHISVQGYKQYILHAIMIIFMVGNLRVLKRIIIEGKVGIFPYSLSYAAGLVVPGVYYSVICPCLIIGKKKHLQRFCSRKVRGLLNVNETLVRPIV